MTDITELAQSHELRNKVNHRLYAALEFQGTLGEHATISLSIDECKSVIAALDERLALAEALEKAQRAGSINNQWKPDVCPITGRRFFLWIEHPEFGYVPTYGGPYDSYTIPTRDSDGEFSCERYDHDFGGWVDGECVGAYLIDDDEQSRVYELEQRIAELESFRTAYMEWSDKADWVRTDRRFDVVKPLGKHLADVLKAYIGHLECRVTELEESNAQVIQSRDHYKRMTEEGLKQLAESRTVTVKQYDEFQICHYGATEDYAKGYIDCQNNFSKWLTAAGIKLEAE